MNQLSRHYFLFLIIIDICGRKDYSKSAFISRVTRNHFRRSMNRTRIVTIIAFLCVVSLGIGFGSQYVWSQQQKPYPTRSITYMVCFDPGGQSDREARR